MGNPFTKEFWVGSPPGEVETKFGDVGLEEMMRQRAMGTGGPSAAELQMQRGMQQQIAAGRSMAASMPGANPGMAMRLAGQREAGAMANVGQQTGILRAQEQAQAQQMLAQYLAQQDQLELQKAMYNAARQQTQGMLGPVLQTGGAVLGGWLGGPAGAAAGSGLFAGGGGSRGSGGGGGGRAPQWADYGFPGEGEIWA